MGRGILNAKHFVAESTIYKSKIFLKFPNLTTDFWKVIIIHAYWFKTLRDSVMGKVWHFVLWGVCCFRPKQWSANCFYTFAILRQSAMMLWFFKMAPTLYIYFVVKIYSPKGLYFHNFTYSTDHRRRIYLEDKAKVIASDWGTEFLPR